MGAVGPGRRLVRMAELRATSADGESVTALDDGSGPPLLLVHGGAGSAASWDAVVPWLVDGFRVVRVTRRIYAPGAVVPPGHSMAVEAADLAAVARRLALPVLLVGHSSGAVAALEAAVRVRALWAGLLLYEPPVPTRSPVGAEAAGRARAALAAGDPDRAVRIQLRDIVREPAERVERLLADPVRRSRLTAGLPAQIADIDAVDALGVGVDRFRRLDLPTTLVEGDRSPAHLRGRLADLAGALPDAAVVTLAGQGHSAHLTAPQALADAIRDAARRAFRVR